MENKEFKFRDPVVERVVDKFVDRSNTGFEKYGKTLHDERTGGHKDLAGYLNDVQEELMDAILYIQAAREELNDKTQQRIWDKDNFGYQKPSDEKGHGLPYWVTDVAG
tara:strand:- start:157 stop:480 length:324 start_codon:yes stop_codon:yes gene_type:complete